jgi:type IV pilus assembly protein PilN
MIKVNLVGAGRKKTSKAGAKLAMPTSVMPFLLAAIVLGAAGGGYWWYSSLSNQLADLDSKITQAEAQKAALDNVIKQDAIYEARKKALENRVQIIQDLQRNQVSPVMALDALSEAVDKTEYVWLSSLDQNNAIFNMSGQGTSYEAVATFITNLEASGYFRNVDVPNVQEAGTNTFTFTLKCEFLPATTPAPATPSTAGGN